MCLGESDKITFGVWALLITWLVMQYRLDHLENMGADIWDFSGYPVQKIKGFVEDYVWQPGEKIFTSEEGDVELLQPKHLYYAIRI